MLISLQNLEAADRLIARFRALANPDASPLMLTWQRLIVEDNRRGVLAGTDKDGNPLAPVTYRPVGEKIHAYRRSPAGVTPKFIGMNQAWLFGNLPSSMYRRLDGPPLAPRGVFSRVIQNLKTDSDHPAADQWRAWGYWDEVVARDGKTKFLKYHFMGIKQKRRDLSGVRPEGVRKAKEAAVNWMRDMVRSGGV